MDSHEALIPFLIKSLPHTTTTHTPITLTSTSTVPPTSIITSSLHVTPLHDHSTPAETATETSTETEPSTSDDTSATPTPSSTACILCSTDPISGTGRILPCGHIMDTACLTEALSHDMGVVCRIDNIPIFPGMVPIQIKRSGESHA